MVECRSSVTCDRSLYYVVAVNAHSPPPPDRCAPDFIEDKAEAKLESSNFEYIAGSEIVGHFGGGAFWGRALFHTILRKRPMHTLITHCEHNRIYCGK